MKSFGARSSAEQRFIVQQPRPLPSLNLKTRDRVFQDGWYDKKDWLCGSQGRKALFCWPCLLFRPGISRSWTVTGYTNMHSILSDSRKHIKSNSHMESYKIWKTFDLHERVDVQLSIIFHFRPLCEGSVQKQNQIWKSIPEVLYSCLYSN